MQFRRPHPWDGQYALPDNVLAEPPRFGTITTKPLPRRTIDAPKVPPPWETGYAYPDYVEEEPIGGGVFRTKYMPRRTVDMLIPDPLGGMGDDDIDDMASTPSINIHGGTAWLQAAQARYDTDLPMLGAFEAPINADAGQAWIAAAEQQYGFSLGADDVAAAASHNDAIGRFGKEAAARVLATVRSLPQRDRGLALRTSLDKLEPGLYRRVVFKAKENEHRGAAPATALRNALASQMSTGLVAELVRTGKTGAVNRRSMLGASCGLHPLSGCCPMGADEVVVAARGGTGSARARETWQVGPLAFATTPRIGAATRYHGGPITFDSEKGRPVARGNYPPQVLSAISDAVLRSRQVLGRAGYGNSGNLMFVLSGHVAIAKMRLPNGQKAILVGKRLPSRITDPMGGISFEIKRPSSGPLAFLASIVLWPVKKVTGAAYEIGGKIADVAGDVVDAVGGLACKAVSSEEGQVAAAAGAAALGEPPQAGAAGAQIAAGLCTGPDGQTLPPPAPAGGFPIVPVAIGGAALLAWWYMSRRKR